MRDEVSDGDGLVAVGTRSAGEIDLLVVAQALDDAAAIEVEGYRWWPEPVMAALRDAMAPAGTLAGRYLYVPAARHPESSPPRETGACAARTGR